MAPLVRELSADQAFTCAVCVTAQHRELLDGAMHAFDLVADFDLRAMEPGQSLTTLSARVLTGLASVIDDFEPQQILVHGDTATTAMASIVGYFHRIPVCHVEAGLRTFNMYAPWPEEGNRKIAGALASLHFAPTDVARTNLLREGVAASHIFVTGNTVIDALLLAIEKIDRTPRLKHDLRKHFQYLQQDGPLLLVTAHRRESFGVPFENICRALLEIATQVPELRLVFPVHLNPHVREPVFRILAGCPNIHLIEPLEYLPFVHLMTRATLILTDSGGIQEEAPAVGKPVLVMRDVTERPEAIAAGTACLVGTEQHAIVAGVIRLLKDRVAYLNMSKAANPYGDGRASKRIRDVLLYGQTSIGEFTGSPGEVT